MNVFEALSDKVVHYQLVAPWSDKDYDDGKDSQDYKNWDRMSEASAQDEAKKQIQAQEDLWGRDQKKKGASRIDEKVLATLEKQNKSIYILLGLISCVNFVLFTISIGSIFFIIYIIRKFQKGMVNLFGTDFTTLQGIGVIVGIFIICIVTGLLGNAFAKYRSRLYKKTIVHNALGLFFDVNYVESDHSLDSKYKELIAYVKSGGLEKIVGTLKIRNGKWSDLDYNDLFMLEYDGKPILLIDMSLKNSERMGKKEALLTQFMGQLMIIPIKTPCQQSERYVDSDEAHEGSPEIENKTAHPPVLEKTCYSWLRKGDLALEKALTNIFHGCTIPEQQEAPVTLDEWGGKYYNVFKSLGTVAKCDCGVVVTKSFMVLILENDFDPFEFGFSDNFKPFKVKSKVVTRQAAWVCRVVKALVEGNVV